VIHLTLGSPFLLYNSRRLMRGATTAIRGEMPRFLQLADAARYNTQTRSSLRARCDIAKRFDTTGIRSKWGIAYGVRKEFQLGCVHQLCAFR